ncbi:MarR family transcriptional regulator [Nocardioides antri]|uniref:MarR family transcriptional regulator n=2 Tax=Nocardioides antri TaxID=2607659 RepID=A0A5B1M4J2_9ACTN|nr:MarR family transcriptional regulator [Nocardioides antri]
MTYAHDMPTPEKAVRTDAGLASELRLSVMRLRRRLAAERHPDNPLSMGQLALLGALYRNGDQSVGELAARERVQPPSMTRTINCLADGGYVERRSHPSDGRQVVVALTDEGRAVLLADRARRDEWLSRRLAGLSAEERDVLRRATPILQRLAEAD